jgi:hypothetical protein
LSEEEVRYADDLEEGLVALGIQYQADGTPRYVAIYSMEAWMGAYKDKAIGFVNAHSSSLTESEVAALEREGKDLFFELLRKAPVGAGAPVVVVEVEDDGSEQDRQTKSSEG